MVKDIILIFILAQLPAVPTWVWVVMGLSVLFDFFRVAKEAFK